MSEQNDIHFVGGPFDGLIKGDLEQNDVELENWPDGFFYTMIEGKMLWIENDQWPMQGQEAWWTWS